MSRLLDKIKKQTQSPLVQMGFRRTAQEEITPAILLIARVTIDAAGSPVSKIEGADAVLIEAGDYQPTVKSLLKITKPLGETPWGIFLEDCEDKPEALEEAGCDFVILSPACSVASVPQSEKMGKILQVESAMDDGLLRAVNDLPADAVLAADIFGENERLTWHHLMLLRNMAMLIRKPLLIPVPAEINSTELKAAWEAGIEAVVVPVDTAKGENLKVLHDAALKLPPRALRKPGKVDVFLPRPTEKAAAPPPEEEEE